VRQSKSGGGFIRIVPSVFFSVQHHHTAAKDAKYRRKLVFFSATYLKELPIS
jgi:hypothetical protein